MNTPGVLRHAGGSGATALLFFIAAFSSEAVRADNGPTRAADENAARALLTRMVDAWNTGDSDAGAALFIDDGEMISADGTHWRGPADIARYNSRLITGSMKGSQVRTADTDVRFLTADVAIVRSRASFRMANKAAPERHALWSLIAIREGATWRVALLQSTHAARSGPNE